MLKWCRSRITCRWTAPSLFQPRMFTTSPYSTRAGIHAPTLLTDSNSKLLLLSKKWPNYTLSFVSQINNLIVTNSHFFFFYIDGLPTITSIVEGFSLVRSYIIRWLSIWASCIQIYFLRTHSSEYGVRVWATLRHPSYNPLKKNQSHFEAVSAHGTILDPDWINVGLIFIVLYHISCWCGGCKYCFACRRSRVRVQRHVRFFFFWCKNKSII